MGLLDFSGFVGDDTAKDEYGMTQADRRQPLFGGLLKAGMLGMAAGENITPGQRAQLLGQMGGAIADIPEARNKAMADAAQMQIRRQQFQTNQQKLEQAAKLKAYAQTPEFAEMIKDMPEFQKAGLKFLIESGDADSVQRLLSSYQTAQTAQAETQRKERRDDAKEAAKAAADAAKESGFGNTPYGINARNLRDAPIDSYAYWLAVQFFSSEQKNPDGSVIPKLPNMTPAEWKPGMPPGGTPGRTVGSPAVSAAPPAAETPAAPAPAPGTPAPGAPPVPPPGAPPVPPVEQDPNKLGWTLDKGKDVVQSDGTRISRDTRGGVWIEPPDAPATYQETPTSTPKTFPQVEMPERHLTALTTYHTGLSSVEALENELKTKKVILGPQARFISALAGDTGLNVSNPEGQRARQLIASLTSEKIKAMSGAAVSEAEFARLDRFLPKDGDTLEQIQTKLIDLRRELETQARARFQTLPRSTRVPAEFRQRFGAQSTAPAGGGGGGGGPSQKEIADELERRRKAAGGQ